MGTFQKTQDGRRKFYSIYEYFFVLKMYIINYVTQTNVYVPFDY